MRTLTRRHLIQGSSLLAASALLSACGKKEVRPEDLWRTPNPSTKGYYGFIDESGSWAIPPQFDRDSDFLKYDVAPVFLRRNPGERSGSFIYSGIIDASGEWVREPGYGLEMGRSFSEGLVDTISRDDPGHKSKDDMGGYMGTSGEWVIEPKISVGDGFLQPFCAANSFVGEPYAMAPSLVDKESDTYRHGLIDKRGEWLIEPRFKYLDVHFKPEQTQVGLAVAAESSGGDESLCGFIDNTGSWVIPPTFKFASNFVGEYAWARDVGTELMGLIAQDGQWATHPKYRTANPIDAARAFVRDPQSKLVGVLDLSQDSWILEPRWYDAWTESSHTYVMAMTEKGGPVGIYAMDTGETVLEPAYKDLMYGSPLIAAQELGSGLWGYIDIGGTWVIEPVYRDTWGFSSNGLASAQEAM
ncbi:WG repeat-containing protein [Lancefieldella rimae]|uniref:WG repeat-containing protein n=1 Tax=Lancefieldella rimae TaxID=1383 RepID=UPI0028EDA786|nr:WG repeat-containing protein [Lancefieldella rimae]